jgi:predicted ATP-binding protein involved in virulence
LAHQRHLVDILTDTVTGSQNNSVLLVGDRGSGKTLVLDSAIRVGRFLRTMLDRHLILLHFEGVSQAHGG